MASICKRKGKWCVRWRDPDGRERFRACPNKRAAETLERDIDAQRSLGRVWEPTGLRARPRVAEVLNARLSERSHFVETPTLRILGESFEYAFRCWGPDLALEDWRSSHLTELWAFLKVPHRGRVRKDTTCKKHVENVQAAWAWAATDERFEADCPHPRTIPMRKSTPKLPIAPTWTECDAMIAQLGTEWHRRAAVLARFTGARHQEVLELDWSDVDLEHRTVRWRPEILKGGIGARVVPMPEGLHAELVGWGRREGRIVSAPEKELQADTRGHLGRDLARAWKRSGVRREAWFGQPMHAFRKAMETELRAHGVSKEAIDAYTGHVDSSTGGRHYADSRWSWGPLVAAVALIPPIGRPNAAGLEVVS